MNETSLGIGETATSTWIRIPIKAVVLYMLMELKITDTLLIIVMIILISSEIPEYFAQKYCEQHPKATRKISTILGLLNITVTFVVFKIANLIGTDLYLLIFIVIGAISISSGLISGLIGGFISALLYLILSVGVIDPFDAMFRAIIFVFVGLVFGLIAESNLQNIKRYNSAVELVTHRNEANNLKENFLTIAYHSLRTPLTSIKGYASALDDPTMTKEEREDYFGKMQESIQNMGAIMENVFKVVRVEEDYELQIEKYDLIKLIQEIIQTMSSQAQRRNVQIHLTFPKKSDILEILIDAPRLQTAFTNIIDNAIRYSNPKENVEIEIIDGLNLIKINITNTGKGISPAEMNFIFEKFHRVNVLTPESEGLGIGLYIARKIIQKHNGTLEIHSVPGKLTIANITIPKETGRTFFSGIS